MADVAAPTNKVPVMSAASIANGAGPAVGAPKPPHVTSLPPGAPKPVECMSVPDTPVKGRTPTTGSPAPELRIEQEPAGGPVTGGSQNDKHDKNAILGNQDPSVPKRPAPEPEEDLAGPDTAELHQQQSKETSSALAEGAEPGQSSNVSAADAEKSGDVGAPPEKKTKLTDKAADLMETVKTKIQQKTGDQKAGGKSNISRNNKDKPRAAAGKTERKTRSQGPVAEDSL